MTHLGSEIAFVSLEEPEQRPAAVVVLTKAEVAECSCPDFCERDHDRD